MESCILNEEVCKKQLPGRSPGSFYRVLIEKQVLYVLLWEKSSFNPIKIKLQIKK